VSKPPRDTDADAELVPTGHAPLESTTEPPVVARLIVEIRSDGTRTVARGAIEDVVRGDRTTIEARGSSPLQLALALSKALMQLPRMAAGQAMRGLLGRKKP
jgi:hypothetical protein